MINMEINYEDCAIVLKPNGGIDVYCPPTDSEEFSQPNVRMLRAILTALVKSAASTEDVQDLLQQIDENLTSTPTDRTLH